MRCGYLYKTNRIMKIIITGSLGNISKPLATQLITEGHEVTVITGAPGVFTDQLRQVAIPCLQVRSLVRPLQPHRDVAAFLQLSSVLCHLKPDVLCAHTAKAGSLGRAAARLLDIPCVFTPHGWSMFDRTSLQWNPLFCWAESIRTSTYLRGQSAGSAAVLRRCRHPRQCIRSGGCWRRRLVAIPGPFCRPKPLIQVNVIY